MSNKPTAAQLTDNNWLADEIYRRQNNPTDRERELDRRGVDENGAPSFAAMNRHDARTGRQGVVEITEES